MTQKTDIKNLSLTELERWLAEFKIPSYRAKQIFRWIYIHQAGPFTQMKNIGKELQELLTEHFTNDRLEIIETKISKDSTKKFLFRLNDSNLIESVLIPEKEHDTLCISSQVGCALACAFCLTGKGGFTRNLSKSEIISQVRDIRAIHGKPEKLTNIVFMGMGEPLLNYDNVLFAVNVMCDGDNGLGFSRRKITLSTSGIVPAMLKLGTEAEINLAISLNSAMDATRSMLMPINQKYPLSELLDAAKKFPLKPYRRITFEYILIQGLNDSAEDAKRLTRLLKGIKSKINLIPFNEHEGSELKAPTLQKILAFQKILTNNKYTAIIRKSKGADILAACGQLRAKQNQDYTCQKLVSPIPAVYTP